MDEELWNLIESERGADEAAELLTAEDLTPVSFVQDAEGWAVEVYADGSYVVKVIPEQPGDIV